MTRSSTTTRTTRETTVSVAVDLDGTGTASIDRDAYQPSVPGPPLNGPATRDVTQLP